MRRQKSDGFVADENAPPRESADGGAINKTGQPWKPKHRDAPPSHQPHVALQYASLAAPAPTPDAYAEHRGGTSVGVAPKTARSRRRGKDSARSGRTPQPGGAGREGDMPHMGWMGPPMDM